MDETVTRAMQRWPDVPKVFGWLRLDRRGRWRVKMPHGGFEPITNAGVVAFIGRNYARDDEGRWFFQNGPQRVFVTLETTPWVYRLGDDGTSVETHTGLTPANLVGAWLTDDGGLVLATEIGPGVLHDRDLAAVENALVTRDGKRIGEHALADLFDSRPGAETTFLALHGACVPLQRIAVTDLARRFGFNPDPRPAPGEPDC